MAQHTISFEVSFCEEPEAFRTVQVEGGADYAAIAAAALGAFNLPGYWHSVVLVTPRGTPISGVRASELSADSGIGTSFVLHYKEAVVKCAQGA